MFPGKITIGDNGVTMHVPSFFSGKETTIPFSRISTVDIQCPLIGFSSITISTAGEGRITANGFTKAEVKEMKEMILEKING